MVQSYEADAAEIDPRLKFTDIDPSELARVNAEQPHSKSMRALAARLRAGEPIAISSRRVRRLLPADALPPWMVRDLRAAIVVSLDDSITRADTRLPVHS